MSYGADFANADPANAPLDPTIMIGADPFFWGAILLGLAAALLLGWFLGARSNTHRADAAQAIWKAIQSAAQSAMASDDNALKGKAEALRKVIQDRLGKTLILAGGLSGRIKKLDDAIAGKGPVQPGGGSNAGGGGGQSPPRAGGGSGGDAKQGESGNGGSGGGGGGGGAAASAAASVTVVTIGGPATTAPPPPPPPPPPIGDLSHREQTDALRLAVAAFNEHWRHEGTRVGELRAAHAELSNPGSAHGSSGHGKASHGGH